MNSYVRVGAKLAAANPWRSQKLGDFTRSPCRDFVLLPRRRLAVLDEGANKAKTWRPRIQSPPFRKTFPLMQQKFFNFREGNLLFLGQLARCLVPKDPRKPAASAETTGHGAGRVGALSRVLEKQYLRCDPLRSLQDLFHLSRLQRCLRLRGSIGCGAGLLQVRPSLTGGRGGSIRG